MESNKQPRGCTQDVHIDDNGVLSVGKPQMNKPQETERSYDDYRKERDEMRFGMFNPVRKRTK